MKKIDTSLMNEYIRHQIDVLRYEKGIDDNFIYIALGDEIANQLYCTYDMIFPSSHEEKPKYMGYPVEIDIRIPTRVAVCVEYPIPVFVQTD